MNNLQKLLKLRGLTVKETANRIGQGYHITQKVIKGATYRRQDGTYITRSNRTIETGVARLLGLSHAEVWGKGSSRVLPKLIEKEIKAIARQQESNMRKQWLSGHTLPKKQAGGNV